MTYEESSWADAPAAKAVRETSALNSMVGSDGTK